jgi:hypothetical protein
MHPWDPQDPERVGPRYEAVSWLAAPAPEGGPVPAASGRRKRGRPLEMTRDELLAAIRRLSDRREGLIRIHHTHSALYARARRQYGSWSNAVRAAGLDYDDAMRRVRERSRTLRRRT